MKSLSFLLLLIISACTKQVSIPETPISTVNGGTVIDVWGCAKGGYANNSIYCNIETDKYKLANVNISSLIVQYISIGDIIIFKTTRQGEYTKTYLCINDRCSLYYAKKGE